VVPDGGGIASGSEVLADLAALEPALGTRRSALRQQRADLAAGLSRRRRHGERLATLERECAQ
jgi:hypothetical protein